MKINVWNTYKDRYEISKLENARILESWFHTNNKTLINGGAIYTGSITAEKLNIGMNPNLLVDGLDSFEQYPDGKMVSGVWSIGSMMEAHITSERGYDGKKSLKLIGKSDTDSQNSYAYLGKVETTKHTAESNKNYILSLYAMSTVATDVNMQVSCPMRTATGAAAGWEHGKTFPVKANSTWTRYYFFIPKKNVETAYASIYFRILKAMTGNEGVYVDAIQLEEVPDTVTEPSPFKPAGTTVIHGGNITAGSITFNSSNYGGVAIDGNGMLISHAKSTISMNGNKGIEVTRKSDNKRVLYVDGVGDIVIDGKVTIGSNTVFENGYDPTKLNSGMRNIARNTNFENDFKYWTQSAGNKWRIIDPTPDRPTSKYVATSATGLSAPGYISLYSSKATANKGESITFSTEFFVDDLAAWDKKSPFIVEFYDSTGTRVEWKDVYLDDMGAGAMPAKKWNRLSYTMACTKDNVTHVGLRLCLMQNGSVYYREPKMERGTVATDWMPAPEDVKENLQSVSDVTTTITNDLGKITLEVRDNKTKVVSSINASTEGIKIKGNLVDIQGQVTFSSLDATMQGKVNAGTTANDNFNNMQIGSGNILSRNWLAPNAHVSSSYDAETDTWSVTGKSGASSWGTGLRIIDKKMFIPSGSWVTLSFDVWTPNDANWAVDVNNRYVNKDTTTNDNDEVAKRTTSPKALKANTWTRVWSTWKAKDGEDDMYDYSNFGVVNNTGVDQLYKFRRIKLELGNQPTPWSDSLADIREDININLTSLQDIAFSQGKRFYSHSYTGEFVPEAIAGTINKNGVIGTSTWAFTGNAWIYGRNPIPVDVTRTYKLRFRVRVTTNDASGTNNMYAGVATLDKNFINLTGGAGTHRYFAASNVPLKTTDGWRTFEGTITGVGDSANQFRANTAYVRPMFIVNNSGTTGVSEVDLLEFIDITEASDAQKTADTVTTNFNNSKDTWNNITNIVNGWKGAAIGGTTTINGGLIETSTITANKLFLGDTTNLCENPDFENDANGAFPIGFTQTNNVRVKDISGFGTGGNGSNRALELDALNGSNNDVYSNSFIPVTPGQQFYVEAESRYLNTAGTGVGRIGFSCYSAKKVHLSNWSSAIFWNGTKLTTFTKKGAIWTVPDNCYYVYIWISFQNNGETTNKWYVDNIRIHRAAGAEMIVDGSITARHVQGDSITGDKIKAGTLTAREIAASSISADKIRVGSFENLYTNGSFELGDVNWGGTSYQILKDASIAYKGNWYMRIPHDGKFNDIYDTNPIAVLAGERYYFEGYARTLTGTASTRVFIVQWLNKDGGVVTHNYPTEALTTTWKKITYALDVPPDAVQMRIGASVGGLNTAGNYTLFCNLFCKRMMAGELIVDGSIWANKIGANAITVDKLNVNNIFGNSAVVQKVQTYDLSANRIVSGNLEVGGSQLVVGTAWAVSGLPTNKSAGLDLGMQVDSGEDYLVMAQATANELFAYLKRVPLVGGKKITVSYDYFLDSNVKGVDVFILASKAVATESNVWSTGFDYQYVTADTVYDERTDVGNGWFRVRKTYTLANDIKSGFVRLDMNGTKDGLRGNTRIRSLMVNYGNLAMDWQPHSDEDISIGGINARHIAANSITAREIQAGSITANELSVLAKDFVNNFSITKNLTGYTTGAATCTIVNDPLNVKGSVMKMTTGADVQIQSDFFEVNPSKTYRFKVSGYVPNPTATTGIYFGFYPFNENKVEIPCASYVYELKQFEAPKGNPYFWVQSAAGALTFKDGWIDMEAIVAGCNAKEQTDIPASKFVERAFIFPPGTKYAKMRFFHHYSKTSIDSYWAHPSVTEIDGGLFTFDQAQGGTLKLGTDTGNGFLQVVKQGEQGQKETVGQIDETGAYFPKIQADVIIGGVVGVDKTTGQVFFDSVNGNDNSAGTRAAPKRNIQAYIDQMAKYIVNKVELIQLNGNIDSPIFLKGFIGPGEITVRSDNSGARKTINSGIVVDGVTCRLYIAHFIMQAQDRTMAETGTDSLINVTGSPNVDIWFCKLYGNKKVEMGITGVRWAYIRAVDIEIYNVKSRAFSIIYNATAYIKNCKGGQNPYSILSSDYAVVQGEGTRPDGTVARWANSYIGGYMGDGLSWRNDIWTVDYGEATPPTPPPPTEYVREWSSNGGANWSASGYWDTENYVKQGNWGYGDRTGIWWFGDDMANTLRGKTIIDAQIYITRANKGGNSGSREAQIRAHQHPSKPAGAPGVSNEYVSAWFTWGEGKWVSITSFVQQKIANGVDRGFGLYIGGSQANYMAFDTYAKVWVKYK